MYSFDRFIPDFEENVARWSSSYRGPSLSSISVMQIKVKVII